MFYYGMFQNETYKKFLLDKTYRRTSKKYKGQYLYGTKNKSRRVYFE